MPTLPPARRASWVEAHGFVLVPVLFYLLTVGRSMGMGDVAMLLDRMVELPFSTDANRHNLAMLVGHAFLWLPVGELALRANLMSATFGAATIIAFYTLLRRLGRHRLTPIAGASLLMVSHSVWWHSTIAENYILHAFLIVLVLHLHLRFWVDRRLGALYGAFALSGLAVFNHVQNGVWPVATGALALMAVPRIRRGEYTQPRGLGWLLPRRPLTGAVIGALGALLVGMGPYLALFLWEARSKGGVGSALDSASGGQFKDRMFNFDDLGGFWQSFWYLHLQFPSLFYLLVLAGGLYFAGYGWWVRRRPVAALGAAGRRLLWAALALGGLMLVINEAWFLAAGEVLALGPLELGGRHFTAAWHQTLIGLVLAGAALRLAHGAGALRSPADRPEFVAFQPAVWLGAGVTAFFFWFFNTWDQFAFWLPVYLMGALCGALLLDDALCWLWPRVGSAGRGLVGAGLALSVAAPPLYYAKIPAWCADPGSWWFEGGPYGDNRFINTHDRVAYNYNPNKSGWDDMDRVVDLVFQKLPPNSTLVDDDSRLFYPINSYYRKYVQRPDQGRPDLKLLLINVWGHHDWGVSIDQVVKAIGQGKYDERSHPLFLIAGRNYPHRDILARLDSGRTWFLPWFLDNTHWVYGLRVFGLTERAAMPTPFPPLNVHYLTLGTGLRTDQERATDDFRPGEDVMARIVFDRLPEKVRPFTLSFEVSRTDGAAVSTVADQVQPGWKAVTLSLGLPPSLAPGPYDLRALVHGQVVFQRRFTIRG